MYLESYSTVLLCFYHTIPSPCVVTVGDIRTGIVEYELCFCMSTLSHFGVYFGHVVDNIGEDRSGCIYRAATSY